MPSDTSMLKVFLIEDSLLLQELLGGMVSELDGVEWINDSKATNVDSSLVALKALGGPIVLIAGGKGKGAPYEPMVQASKGKVKAVLTLGQDAPTIAAAYRGFEVIACGTLENAVGKAQALAGRGDTVLLSPACASYDQFDNFEHRGDTFKRLVRALPSRGGAGQGEGA